MWYLYLTIFKIYLTKTTPSLARYGFHATLKMFMVAQSQSKQMCMPLVAPQMSKIVAATIGCIGMCHFFAVNIRLSHGEAAQEFPLRIRPLKPWACTGSPTYRDVPQECLSRGFTRDAYRTAMP